MKKFLHWLGYLVIALLILIIGYAALNYQADMPVAELVAKYTNTESEFVEVDNMIVHYRDEGDPNDSIPLLLLHGTSSSLLTWDKWTEMLKPYHRIIRIDLPGFALTGPNLQQDYSMQYYCEFLSVFLRNLGIKQCYVAGNSLGGSIAWNFAVASPETVKKLILIDAGGYSVKGKRSGGALGFQLARMPIIKNLVRYVTPRSIVAKSLQDAYGDDSKVTDKLVDIYFDMTLREGNRVALIARMSQMWTNDATKIKQIQTPTLILWGDLDQLIPVEHAELFHQDIKGSQVIIYPKVGHVPMEEIPEQTAVDAKRFLGSKK